MSLETEAGLLRGMPLFRSINPARCKLVAMSSDSLVFQPGDAIFAEGEASDAVFIIVQGRVRSTRNSRDRVHEIGQLSDGALLGETGVITGRPRSATVVALAETTALRLDGRVFLELLQQVPEVCYAMVRELASRAEDSENRLTSVVDNV